MGVEDVGCLGKKEVSSGIIAPCSTANVDEQTIATDWDPLISMDYSGSAAFPPIIAGAHEFHGMENNHRNEQIASMPYFASKSFSEMLGAYPLCESSQVSSALFPPELPFGGGNGIDKNLKGTKRKLASSIDATNSHSPSDKQGKISPELPKSPREKDEKKVKLESDPSCNNNKSSNTHGKENSQNADTSKEDYVHVRAKRGQATNSHSLAERLRREKISERMRLLQDLVPGCNKITGKAMMLDEIINYVQSLQRQVEFLSMKLAAIHPGINFDIEQILSKDILHSRDSGINTPYIHMHGLMQTDIGMAGVSVPLISPAAQAPSFWVHDLQHTIPMSFIPNPPMNNNNESES